MRLGHRLIRAWLRDPGDPDENAAQLTRASGDEGGDRAQCSGIETVVDPSAALLSVEEAGLDELLEMVRKRRLRNAERCGQVASARCGVGRIGHESNEPESYRIRQCLQDGGQPFGLCGRQECREAGGRAFQDGQDSAHATESSDIDIC